MSPYRRFDLEQNQLADAWFASGITSEQWVLGNPVGIGEAQSLHASSPSGQKAFAKPAFSSDGTPRAAHEKIASDLAYRLGVPVPPVTLWRGPGDQRFSISAQVFRQPLNWDQFAPLMTPSFRSNAAPLLAAGLVFHTFISDSDHGGNGGNVVIDANSSETWPGIAFIDHAYSMSQNWNGAATACVPISNYYERMDALPTEVIAECVNLVRGIPEVEFGEIVSRVPPDFLQADRRETVLKCLLTRQAQLGAAFGVA